jgi:hypothetical protein
MEVTMFAEAKVRQLAIYDPAQCCATGACSPDADDQLAQFASALEWLKQSGVEVSRYNLGHQPGAFATNPTVKGALQAEGVGVLPMLIVDGEVIAKGRYPSRAELGEAVGLGGKPLKTIAVAAASCCAPAPSGKSGAGGSSCCG